MSLAFNQAAVMGFYSAVVDTAKQLQPGVFARVNGHEPRSAPGAQSSCSFWISNIRPFPRRSPLNKVSGLVVVSGRIYRASTGANEQELDAIDPELTTAACTLMAAYSGGFTLGGQVAAVDLLGQSGTALEAQAAYVPMENKQYRVMELTIPSLIDDMWTEAA